VARLQLLLREDAEEEGEGKGREKEVDPIDHTQSKCGTRGEKNPEEGAGT